VLCRKNDYSIGEVTMADDKVEVQITTNAAGLDAGVKQATAAFDGGTAQIIGMLEKLLTASVESTASIVAN
jgi:hypothetical protein